MTGSSRLERDGDPALVEVGPLPYTLRVSARARRVRLLATAAQGLVVVVPSGWMGDAGALVAGSEAWARRALARVGYEPRLAAGGFDAIVPSRIDLAASDESWVVELRTAARTTRVLEQAGVLIVEGDTDDAASCLRALRDWLSTKARRHLAPRCIELAQTHGALPGRVRITSARTRWGSCSARRTISLNRALMFASPGAVDGLILHEIAHLRHMNHSPRFWAHLRDLDPDWRRHRDALRALAREVPFWAQVELSGLSEGPSATH